MIKNYTITVTDLYENKVLCQETAPHITPALLATLVFQKVAYLFEKDQDTRAFMLNTLHDSMMIATNNVNYIVFDGRYEFKSVPEDLNQSKPEFKPSEPEVKQPEPEVKPSNSKTIEIQKVVYQVQPPTEGVPNKLNHFVAYTDGSYNPATNEYAGGVMLMDVRDKLQEPKQIARKQSDEAASMRNVAGELLAVQLLLELVPNKSVIDLYYDYEGIEKWATGGWKAKNEHTKAYVKLIEYNKKTRNVTINFKKVTAHTGVLYNELADKLAKQVLGLA